MIRACVKRATILKTLPLMRIADSPEIEDWAMPTKKPDGPPRYRQPYSRVLRESLR